MLKTLHLQTQPDFSKSSLCLFNPIVTTNTSIQNAIFVPKSPVFSVSLSLCHEIQIQKQIVCARKNKRRAGSLRLPRLLRQLMPVIVSNLKILPQPLDLVIEEICSGDGNGGGLGIRKGFGGGGGFDGFGRKRNRKLFLLFLLYGILVISGLGLLFGSEVESNVLCCGLGFGLSGVAMVQWWEKIDMNSGLKVFDNIPKWNVVAWTSLISGFVGNNQATEAIKVFKDMELQNVQPNEFTMVHVVVACARSRDIDTGKLVHSRIRQLGQAQGHWRRKLQRDIKVTSFQCNLVAAIVGDLANNDNE
ncbi:hypothetical protein GBA52_018664 [Prunus armeniaca]|nr:hypothetical protein GBA52_018664 [Prunus armeniaca]